MKTLRQLCVALVFTFALTAPTFGGIIDTPPAPPPPTPQSAPGEIQTPTTDPATQVALSLLRAALSLF